MACHGHQDPLASWWFGQDSPYNKWCKEYAKIELESFPGDGGPLLFPLSNWKFFCWINPWMQSQTYGKFLHPHHFTLLVNELWY